MENKYQKTHSLSAFIHLFTRNTDRENHNFLFKFLGNSRFNRILSNIPKRSNSTDSNIERSPSSIVMFSSDSYFGDLKLVTFCDDVGDWWPTLMWNGDRNAQNRHQHMLSPTSVTKIDVTIFSSDRLKPVKWADELKNGPIIGNFRFEKTWTSKKIILLSCAKIKVQFYFWQF